MSALERLARGFWRCLRVWPVRLARPHRSEALLGPGGGGLCPNWPHHEIPEGLRLQGGPKSLNSDQQGTPKTQATFRRRRLLGALQGATGPAHMYSYRQPGLFGGICRCGVLCKPINTRFVLKPLWVVEGFV